ncbi:hypothetical protein DSO57_1004324 [Entomophthora muscae]|uniref:Uncharacterized protein n=1 Tax=Entomophthora muscae TaxID=34485 RepID=A0ACC2SLM9_9FUNG|nr:hypothetical protein DSO57_1004324 [Entomophthora muscae]
MGLNSYFPQLSPVSSFWSPLRAVIPVLHWAASWWFLSPGWELNLVILAPSLTGVSCKSHPHVTALKHQPLAEMQDHATKKNISCWLIEVCCFTATCFSPFGVPNLIGSIVDWNGRGMFFDALHC